MITATLCSLFLYCRLLIHYLLYLVLLLLRDCWGTKPKHFTLRVLTRRPTIRCNKSDSDSDSALNMCNFKTLSSSPPLWLEPQWSRPAPPLSSVSTAAAVSPSVSPVLLLLLHSPISLVDPGYFLFFAWFFIPPSRIMSAGEWAASRLGGLAQEQERVGSFPLTSSRTGFLWRWCQLCESGYLCSDCTWHWSV